MDELTYDENTLVKVYKALLENGIVGVQALGIVSSMQNHGILFRERASKRRGRPRGSRNADKEEKPAEESTEAPKGLPDEA